MVLALAGLALLNQVTKPAGVLPVERHCQGLAEAGLT